LRTTETPESSAEKERWNRMASLARSMEFSRMALRKEREGEEKNHEIEK